MMYFWLGFLVGVILAVLLVVIRLKITPIGTLVVDESNPEDVKMKFIFEHDIDFSKTKYSTLKVSYTGSSR